MSSMAEIPLLPILNPINIAEIQTYIKTCPKKKLEIYVSGMKEDDIRQMLIASLTSSQSKPEFSGFSNYLQKCFAHKNENKINANHPFTSLPSVIGAYIISFSNMYDRIEHELISKDLYKFCQLPSARYHLIIDQKFAKGLYSNSIHIRKHFNAQYVEIKYVFMDGIFEKFEQKYYSMIGQILSKSPLLHTLNWKLRYKQFRKNLNSTHCAQQYYGYVGNLLEWAENICENDQTARSPFETIRTLIYVPSQYKEDYAVYRSQFRAKFHLFCAVFPSLTRLILPQTRTYTTAHWNNNDYADNEDYEWQLLKSSKYCNQLQHFECNLVQEMPARWRPRHLNILNHPLSHFDKFSQLKTLKLTLALFPNCATYYSRFFDFDQRKLSKCMNLSVLSLDFRVTTDPHFNTDVGDSVEYAGAGDVNVMDRLCRFLLAHCPNIKEYALMSECNEEEYEYSQLIGYLDQIQTLKTNQPWIVPEGARMTSVTDLTFVISLALVDVEAFKKVSSAINNLNGFPNLTNFCCMFVQQHIDHKMLCNLNIAYCLEYLSQQKKVPELKSIRICFDGKKRKHHHHNFCVVESKSVSLLLCKALVSLSVNPNFKIESIVLEPVKLKTKELEYLYFWFNGKMKTTNYYITCDTVLTDCTLLQMD